MLFGIEEEIKKPDVPPVAPPVAVDRPLDLSAADIEELCTAIGAQFI